MEMPTQRSGHSWRNLPMEKLTHGEVHPWRSSLMEMPTQRSGHSWRSLLMERPSHEAHPWWNPLLQMTTHCRRLLSASSTTSPFLFSLLLFMLNTVGSKCFFSFSSNFMEAWRFDPWSNLARLTPGIVGVFVVLWVKLCPHTFTYGRPSPKDLGTGLCLEDGTYTEEMKVQQYHLGSPMPTGLLSI